MHLPVDLHVSWCCDLSPMGVTVDVPGAIRRVDAVGIDMLSPNAQRYRARFPRGVVWGLRCVERHDGYGRRCDELPTLYLLVVKLPETAR